MDENHKGKGHEIGTQKSEDLSRETWKGNYQNDSEEIVRMAFRIKRMVSCYIDMSNLKISKNKIVNK